MKLGRQASPCVTTRSWVDGRLRTKDLAGSPNSGPCCARRTGFHRRGPGRRFPLRAQCCDPATHRTGILYAYRVQCRQGLGDQRRPWSRAAMRFRSALAPESAVITSHCWSPSATTARPWVPARTGRATQPGGLIHRDRFEEQPCTFENQRPAPRRRQPISIGTRLPNRYFAPPVALHDLRSACGISASLRVDEQNPSWQPYQRSGSDPVPRQSP